MTTKAKPTGYSAEERAAMKERNKELRAEANANRKKADGEKDILDAIAKMKGLDKEMAKRIHEIIKLEIPSVWPKTWYGMPAYAAEKDGKVVCFFQAAGKFKARYATFGFNDSAKLDNGNMWPTAFALKDFTQAEESKIKALVKEAFDE